MAKRRVNAALSKTLEIFKNYQALSKCSQRAAVDQLNISRGCLQNILNDKAALQNEASLFGPSERKKQHYVRTRKLKKGFGNGLNLHSLECSCKWSNSKAKGEKNFETIRT